MEMRAIDAVEMGRDLTPTLPPLSHALHDSFLLSHCSACFSPLPAHLFPPPSPGSPSRVLYCSQACSASDSPLHASSGELQFLLRDFPSDTTSDNGDTSDLRAALRLLAALGYSPCGDGKRINGLLTNRDKLLAPETANVEIVSKIRSGAKAMASARKSWKDSSNSHVDMNGTMLEEAAICAVLTNAVEVQDSEGRAVGIAIYGMDFSWVNHSCSPNACYRFQFLTSHDTTVQSLSKSLMWISPFNCGVKLNDAASGHNGPGKEFGPRIMLRSMKPIKKGAEVTVAYTDLLQPKAVRQSELYTKYQFICDCTRCSVEPVTYVDQVLQNFHAVNSDFHVETDGISFNQDEAIEKLTDRMDDVIGNYLSDGNAESCCLKLEKLLEVRVLDEESGLDTGKISQRSHYLQLHPLHYLSIEAHTILASAYKVRGSLITPLSTETERVAWEASGLAGTSAAYSLLLAGSVHHLFCYESSLVGSAANFWANAGESLLNLVPPVSTSSWTENDKTCTCSLVQQPEGYSHLSHASYADFQRISDCFLNCITRCTREIWDVLTHGCRYLQRIRDPINFSWLGTGSDSYSGIVRNVYQHELLGWTAEKRAFIFQLGVHCALYGEFLSSICYGEGSHLTSRTKSTLRKD